MNKIEIPIYNNSKNKLPQYSNENDAGFDIRVDLSRINSKEDLNGNNCYEYHIDENDNKSIKLYPNGGRVLIQSGLHMLVPIGYELQIRPRSGLALKNGITMLNSPGTIDCGYLGDVGMIVINTDPNEIFEIKDGERLAQGVLNEFKSVKWVSKNSVDDLGTTERGDGGFGHTGKQ